MNQKLYRLLQYFRNYSFDIHAQQHINNHSNQSHSGSVSVKVLQTALEQSIMNGKHIIDLYEQRINQLFSQNQIYQQQIQNLKMNIKQDKKESQKLLDSSRQIIQELKRQFLAKQQQNRGLQYKIQGLQQKLQNLEICQAQQLNLLQDEQNTNKINYQCVIENYQLKMNEQKINNNKLIDQLNQQLSDQKQYSSQLVYKINQLNNQVQILKKQISIFNSQYQTTPKELHLFNINKQINQTIKNKSIVLNDSEQRKNKEEYQQNYPTQQFCANLQVFDLTDQFKYNNSQDQFLNRSYEQRPTALKDILNCSNRSNKLNLTKQFIRTQQKQNIYHNLNINQSISSKKLQYQQTQNIYHQNLQMSKDSFDYKFVNYEQNVQQFKTYDQINHSYSIDSKQQRNNLTNKIQKSQKVKLNYQLNLNQQSDFYYIFFVLTAQCIKINSQYFDKIAQIDVVKRQWDYVIRQRIPMNMWSKHLQDSMLKQAGIKLI